MRKFAALALMIAKISPQNSTGPAKADTEALAEAIAADQILTNFMLSLFCLWTRITALMAFSLPHRVLYLASAAVMTCQWGGGERRGQGRSEMAETSSPRGGSRGAASQPGLAARLGGTAG